MAGASWRAVRFRGTARFFFLPNIRELAGRTKKGTIARVTGPCSPLTVWIVEDNVAYRESLVRVTNRLVATHHLRAFPTAEDLLAALAAGPPPMVILLDLGLPGMSGAQALPHIKAQAPQTRVVVLTSFDDQESVGKAICAGAAGYLLKSTEVSQITAAIKDVLAGGAPMTPQVAGIVLSMFERQGRGERARRSQQKLSLKERETLTGMVQGLTTHEIAAKMGVNQNAVDTHVREVYAKLRYL